MADVLNTIEMGQRRYPGFELGPPFEFLGRLVAGFFFLVYGRRGSGKSTFVLGMSRALVELAPLVYVSGEEDHGPTFSARIRRLAAQHRDFHVVLWTDRGADAVVEHVERTGARFVVLDSASRIDPSGRKCQALWEKLKARNVALVAIGHAAKDGSPKVGGTFLEHEVHTVVRVEKVEEDKDEAVATTEKNRYAGLASAPVAFTAAEVEDAGGYKFVAYRPDGSTWFKNGSGDFSQAQYAAMFARMDEDGDRETPKNRSRSRSGGRSSGGSGASPAAAASAKKTASKGGASGPVTRQAQIANDKVREAVEAGVYKDGRERLDVVGTYTDADGRPTLALRTDTGGLRIGKMDRFGFSWKNGQPETALDALTPAPVAKVFPAAPDAEDEAPAPKASARKPAAKKPPAKKPAPKKPTPAKRKPAAKKPAPKPVASAADKKARATLDSARAEIRSITELLAAKLN